MQGGILEKKTQHRFRCRICGKRVKIADTLCNECKVYRYRHGMKYEPNLIEGNQQYTPEGKIICKLCGRTFPYVSIWRHLKLTHNLTKKEYEEKFKVFLKNIKK